MKNLIKELISSRQKHKLEEYLKDVEISEIYDLGDLNAIAIAFIYLEHFDDAENIYLQLIKSNPELKFVLNYLKLLIKIGQFEKVVNFEVDDSLLQSLEIVNVKFDAAKRLGKLESIIKYGRIICSTTTVENIILDVSKALVQLGQVADAKKFLEKSCEDGADSTSIRALLYKISSEINADTCLQFAESIGVEDESYEGLLYTVSEKYYREASIEASYINAEKANAMVSSTTRVNFYDELRSLPHLIRLYKKLQQSTGTSKFTPIFIIGLPRCGSTRFEIVATRYPGVTSIGESGGINKILSKHHDLSGKLDIEKIKDEYIEFIKSRLTTSEYGNSKLIIDKSMGNYRFKGIIHKMFPNAKFIHMTRCILDHKFSIYRNRFANGLQNYSYSVRDINDRFSLFDLYMKYWDSHLLNEKSYELRHEILTEHNALESFLKDLDPVFDAEIKEPINTKQINTASILSARENNFTQTKLNAESRKFLIQKGFYETNDDIPYDLVFEESNLKSQEQILDNFRHIRSLPLKLDIMLSKGRVEFTHLINNLSLQLESPRMFRNRYQGNQLLIALTQAGFYQIAEKVGKLLLSSHPKFLAAMNNYSYVLTKLGNFSESIKIGHEVLDIDPNNQIASLNLVISALEKGNIENALKNAERYINKFPDDVEGLLNFGKVLHKRLEIYHAEKIFKRALELNPSSDIAHAGLAGLAANRGDFESSIQFIDKAIELNPENKKHYVNKLFFLNYMPTLNNALIKSTLIQYTKDLNQNAFKLSQKSSVNTEKLRIGFISGDFRKHSVRYFVLPLLEGLGKLGQQIFAYSNNIEDDSITHKYQSIPGISWTQINGRSDYEVAKIIAEDEIDLLIDLSGHTGGNRLGVFSYRPSKMTATWLGFNSSTGMNDIDYFITGNEVVNPVGDQYFSEDILSLPDTVAAFRPEINLRKDYFEPSDNKRFVFGTNSRSIRLNDRLIDVWSEILVAVKHADLVINGEIHSETEMAEYLLEKFANRGVDRCRIKIFRASPIYEELKNVDLTLDCFPHNSGTTLMESLYAGVPFITLLGTETVGRLGANILSCVGLNQFTVKTVEDYKSLAIAIANDRELLPSKWDLHNTFVKSPIMDEILFCKNFYASVKSKFEEKT